VSIHGERGAWYAWGRLDAGTAPVLGDDVRTVFRFAELYGAAHDAFDREQRVSAPGMVSAWDRFVATAGASVDRQ
jgi:hypothetical protein